MTASSRTYSLSALTRCLQEEASAIAAAAERLSSSEVEKALVLLDRCSDQRAKLVITGVGKSTLVMQLTPAKMIIQLNHHWLIDMTSSPLNQQAFTNRK